MAKDKAKKQSDEKKPKQAKKHKKRDGSPAVAGSPIGILAEAGGSKKVAKVAKVAKSKAADIAAHPAVAEIVAATLVAAAAAIKNPQKARDMATAVGGELEAASEGAVDRGSRFWQLALDVARRSIDALEAEKGSGKGKSKAKKGAAK